MMISRRDLLQGAAALVVGCYIPGARTEASVAPDSAVPPTRKLDPTQLDAWLAVDDSGNVTAYWGKMDMGQGVDTAIAQLIAEELDVDVDRVTLVFGDSGRCVDQGGASGSTGLQRSGVAFQVAAAEARLALFERAAVTLAVPIDSLSVRDGQITSAAGAGSSISYAELIGNGSFDAALGWNGKYGNSLELSGQATRKNPEDYRIVGTSVPRKDIRDKILARTVFLHDHVVPDMLHGRMLRPPSAGARVKRVHRNSVQDLKYVQVVVERDFVGVVAANEWTAIRAARQLEVEWDESDAGFATTSAALHDWIRAAPVAEQEIVQDVGDVDAALADSANVLRAEYRWPFQSHARMAPAASIADIRKAEATVWTDSQKPFDTAKGAAALLASEAVAGREIKVRSIWLPGPGSYGRSDAGDGAMDAVVLSARVGAPVRVQWMRHEGHAWDPKGPASVVNCRGTITDDHAVSGYHFHIKGFSRHDQNSREDSPDETLAGHLLGHSSTPEWRLGVPADSYLFANKRYSWAAVAPLRAQASPLRTSHFRDPYGPEVHFASESFIDELAYACERDPVEFRLAHVAEERDAAVIRAAAELAAWEPHTTPRLRRDDDGNMLGIGIAYAQRGGSVNAIVAEVIVSATTGKVRLRRAWVGADHGLIVNPFTLERTIEGNILQATSRTLFEEVRFDHREVLSVDWATYPVLQAGDAPDAIYIRHINRPDLGPRGAGEPTTRVMPAAIANAIHDATGVRMRQVPFTAKRVLEELAGNPRDLQ